MWTHNGVCQLCRSFLSHSWIFQIFILIEKRGPRSNDVQFSVLSTNKYLKKVYIEYQIILTQKALLETPLLPWFNLFLSGCNIPQRGNVVLLKVMEPWLSTMENLWFWSWGSSTKNDPLCTVSEPGTGCSGRRKENRVFFLLRERIKASE